MGSQFSDFVKIVLSIKLMESSDIGKHGFISSGFFMGSIVLWSISFRKKFVTILRLAVVSLLSMSIKIDIDIFVIQSYS